MSVLEGRWLVQVKPAVPYQDHWGTIRTSVEPVNERVNLQPVAAEQSLGLDTRVTDRVRLSAKRWAHPTGSEVTVLTGPSLVDEVFEQEASPRMYAMSRRTRHDEVFLVRKNRG